MIIMMKLGDAISSNPIVHAIGRATGCVDPMTNDLRPESNCAKTRDDFNNAKYVRDYANSVLDRIRKRGKYKQEK
jgi:hypothetical protein